MEKKFDFSGWATRNDLKCSDGRIIRKDAFKHCDGVTVPLVWNHDHTDPYRIVGHALLENRADGVYTYGSFNDTDLGQTAKTYVMHGDITQLSIYANKLKQQGPNVMHGDIREVSLVMAGANPGAYIENVMAHGEESDEEAVIYTGEDFELYHSEEDEETDLQHADDSKEESKGDEKMAEEKKEGKTLKEIVATMNEEQKNALYTIVGMAAGEGAGDDDDDDEVEHSEGGNYNMKVNAFDNKEVRQAGVLSHADQEAIMELAKKPGVGSFKMALQQYAEENGFLTHAEGEENSLAHAVLSDTDINEYLLPEYELLKKGAPELIERDQSWIHGVLSKIHKSPISRIRTRQADARIAELRALGYQKKGDQKKTTAQIKMVGRTTDPQTIYIKSDMHRDDIIDITDFDPVAYQWNIMNHVMNEELALAALIGDGREDGDPDKIHEDHIRSVWHDDEIYTIHTDVDIAAAKAELQGTDTGAHFGENYIYAEAIITAALYAREKYKGSGALDLYCTPHMLNVMLLARDLNGRRIYDSKADLAAALNVNAIHTVEQFEGKTRTTEDAKVKKLLGLFVNMSDYQFGSTKGGQITRFEDFDMDFNKYKYMLETRLSGSLTKLWSAIALEEDVTGEE